MQNPRKTFSLLDFTFVIALSALILGVTVTVIRVTRESKKSQSVDLMAFSPNGDFLAALEYVSPGAKCDVHVWSVASRQRVASNCGTSLDPILGFSSEALLVSAGDDARTIALSEPPDWKTRRLVHSDFGVLSCATFSPDGKTLAVGEMDPKGSIRLFDIATLSRQVTFTSQVFGVGALAFEPNGKVLASIHALGNSSEIKLWDVATGREYLSLDNKGLASRLMFSPDGKYLATSGVSDVKVWEIRTGKIWFEVPARFATFTPDGQTLVTAGRGRPVEFWDLAMGQTRQNFNMVNRVTCITASTDGATLAIAEKTGDATLIRLVDVTVGDEISRFTLDFPQPRIPWVKFAIALALWTICLLLVRTRRRKDCH